RAPRGAPQRQTHPGPLIIVHTSPQRPGNVARRASQLMAAGKMAKLPDLKTGLTRAFTFQRTPKFVAEKSFRSMDSLNPLAVDHYQEWENDAVLHADGGKTHKSPLFDMTAEDETKPSFKENGTSHYTNGVWQCMQAGDAAELEALEDAGDLVDQAAFQWRQDSSTPHTIPRRGSGVRSTSLVNDWSEYHHEDPLLPLHQLHEDHNEHPLPPLHQLHEDHNEHPLPSIHQLQEDHQQSNIESNGVAYDESKEDIIQIRVSPFHRRISLEDEKSFVTADTRVGSETHQETRSENSEDEGIVEV
ncbi:hypothetical protein CYMTET_18823, partial [Cymbomonas tetramitiformis]